jgi:hypothetical protein
MAVRGAITCINQSAVTVDQPNTSAPPRALARRFTAYQRYPRTGEGEPSPDEWL